MIPDRVTEEQQGERNELNLVKGYPLAYRKSLAVRDYYKKILYDMASVIKVRVRLYPEVIWTGIKSVCRYTFKSFRECSRSLIGGTIYPLRLRIDGKVDREIFTGRLIASIIVTGFYAFKILLMSGIGRFVVLVCGSVGLAFIFFYYMDFMEQVRNESFIGRLIEVPSIEFDLTFVWIGMGIVLSGLTYLGYEKSKDYKGLKYVFNSGISRLIGREKKGYVDRADDPPCPSPEE